MQKSNLPTPSKMLRRALDPRQRAFIVLDSEGFHAMRRADFQPRSTVLTMSGEDFAAIVEKATAQKIDEILELETADNTLQETARAYYRAHSPNQAREAI